MIVRYQNSNHQATNSRLNHSTSQNDDNSEDDNYYDALTPRDEDSPAYYDHSHTQEIERKRNKSEDDTPYVRLQNFAGLSSPIMNMEPIGKNSIDEDDKTSQRGSMISSLSSVSQPYQPNIKERESPSLNFDGLRASPVQPYDLRSDMISLPLSIDSKKSSRIFEKDIIQNYKDLFITPDTMKVITKSNYHDRKRSGFISPTKSRPSSSSSSLPSSSPSPLSSLPSPSASCSHGLGYVKLNSFCSTQEPIMTGNIKLNQTLSYHEGAIWVCKFSPDGKYLCTAGQDTRVIVWIVGLLFVPSNTSSVSNLGYDEPDDSQSHDSKEEVYVDATYHMKIDRNIIHPEPYRIFEGHTSDVVDIAWSKSNFILTASLDKTVSLWLVSSAERIQFFRHPDIVTSVDFHPIHDRYFISGCFDRRLRFWDILPDGHVRAWAQTPETITSVAFDPSGQTVVGGLFNGQVYFYTFDMKYITQINCRNRSGKYRYGRKVTGMAFLKKENSSTANSNSGNDNTNNITNYRPKVGTIREKLIITTNDNRVRLIQTEDYSLTTKYRGLKNTSMQIRANLNDDGRYLISGSENGKIYLWNVSYSYTSSWSKAFSKHNKCTNQQYECIDCTENPDIAVTCAIFAPSNTMYHVLVKNQQHLKSRVRDNSDLFQVEKIKVKLDPILEENHIDITDFSSKFIIAADYDGKIRIYLRETASKDSSNNGNSNGDAKEATDSVASSMNRPKQLYPNKQDS